MAAHVRERPRITPNEDKNRELIIQHRPRAKAPPQKPIEEKPKLSAEERRRISADVMSTFQRVVKKP